MKKEETKIDGDLLNQKSINFNSNVKGNSDKAPEIDKESIIERKQISDLLIGGANELVDNFKKRKNEREFEEIELRSGHKISIGQIREFVIANSQPYSPMFPNNVPFFKEMYRLLEWHEKDHSIYTKPAIVGTFINELIYFRFHRDVYPALKVMAMPGGVRLFKFFQFLSPEGQIQLERFRDEAIELMQKCTTWHEFRLKYAKKFNLPIQLKIYDNNEID